MPLSGDATDLLRLGDLNPAAGGPGLHEPPQPALTRGLRIPVKTAGC
jgi:hypothetical protein